MVVGASPSGRHRGKLPRRWLWVLVPLACSASYAGYTYNVTTAPVSGANIGGGLLMLFSFVFIPAMLGISIFSAMRLRSAIAASSSPRH
jgi:hypothetical protein